MDEEIIQENAVIEENNETLKTRKEQFDEILAKIKKMSEAIELHTDVKEAVSKEEVDYNYLRYIENSLEDKLFNDADTKGIMPKVLLETICPDLACIEDFDVNKLQIENIGSHFEDQENYIDKICVYDNKLICVFGISEIHPNKVIKYEQRKFSRVDLIEAVKSHYKSEQNIEIQQYDEYYVVTEESRIKVFSERKVTSLVKVEETIFDKIKSKLSSFFAKRKNYPEVSVCFDSNPNRILEIETQRKTKSKVSAKDRMKVLLNSERQLTRENN